VCCAWSVETSGLMRLDVGVIVFNPCFALVDLCIISSIVACVSRDGRHWVMIGNVEYILHCVKF